MGLKEIKIRMTAINKTASITFAMHNIALSKIKKSTELLNHSQAFVDKIHDILKYEGGDHTGITCGKRGPGRDLLSCFKGVVTSSHDRHAAAMQALQYNYNLASSLLCLHPRPLLLLQR
ncbi:MAG: hypothetical protein EOM68_21755 [Spirochaetia bacterium]|nr:hypothetical protein [Spirochaetia bacterium]